MKKSISIVVYKYTSSVLSKCTYLTCSNRCAVLEINVCLRTASPTQLEKLWQPTRPSVDGFLCLQHSAKDQLWLIQRDQASLHETHVHIAWSAMVPLGHLKRSYLCWNRGYTNCNHVLPIMLSFLPFMPRLCSSISTLLCQKYTYTQYTCKNLTLQC